MLRLLVLVLVLANTAYFAWGNGLLAAWGLVPARQSEPERLGQQIRPEAVLLVPAPKASASRSVPAAGVAAPLPAASLPDGQEKPGIGSSLLPGAFGTSTGVPVALAAPNGLQCLKIGLFTEPQAAVLKPRLQTALPAGSWTFSTDDGAVRWIVYMGRYISKEAMVRKRVRLEQLGVAYDMPLSPQLNPGLSLGAFGSKAEAESALDRFVDRGIRTAKVVLERPELPSLWLTLPLADAALQTRLAALKLQLGGKAAQPCR